MTASGGAMMSGTPGARLAPPRAAAVAGVIFSVLMGTTLVIIRLVAADQQADPIQYLSDPTRRSALQFALQLAPFAGIAFLWFMGVLRNRIGHQEDQFFATVFFGSGLLFVASLFASAALAGALIRAITDGRGRGMSADVYYLARYIAGAALNVFAIKMAGVFLMSASTIILRTGILPRWLAFAGYACASVLLLIITNWPWIALLFPLWILLVSASILAAEFHAVRPRPAA